MKPSGHFVFIAIVVILILVVEAAVYVPQRATGASVVIKTYPSTNALVQALSDGDVDVAPLENMGPQTLLQLKNDPNLSIIPIGNFGFTYIGLNLQSSPMNDSVFRRAMLYGFNRDRVVRNALAGYGEVLSPGLFSSAYGALGWRNGSVNPYPYDPARASELLDSIGFIQTSTGIRVNPYTGQQLRTMFIFSKLTDPQAVAAANMFAEDMRAIGIPVISSPQTDIDFYSQVSVTYYFDLYIETESANAAPTWLYDLFAGVNNLRPAPLSTNLVGYDRPAFNEYAKLMMTAPSPSSARLAAWKCQEELSLDLPAFPVYSKSLLLVEQKDGLKITPITGSISDTIAASLENMTAGSLLRIGEVGGLMDINPATALGAADTLALRLITTPLLTYGPDGSPRPGLADQWQAGGNATNLTINLSHGPEFQDGSVTTSHDLAATLNWLVNNVLPSAPLYPILKTVRQITEVDPYTVRISLSRSNYFAAYQFANLFALPANSLPQSNSPLALLFSGALQSSGPFELVRFIQGAEADLQSTALPGGAGSQELGGVQGLVVFGSTMGGSHIQIRSKPLTYGGQLIENATFTVNVHGGNSPTEILGSYCGFGLYQASLNLNSEPISPGNHMMTIQLYAQLPTGVIMQFEQQTLVVGPPQFLGQIIVCLLALAAVGSLAYAATREKGKRAKRRTRPRRRTSVRNLRRRRHSPE